MSSKKRAIVRMEGTKYENMKKLERKHIRERGSVRWRDASIAVDFVETNVDALQDREDQYQALMKSLSGDIALIEEQNQQALLEQETEFLNQLSSVEYEMSQTTTTLLQQQSATYENLLQEIHGAFTNEINDLREELDGIHLNQQEKNAIASSYLDDIDRTFEWLRNTYDWEFFFPGDSLDFERRIDTASENYYLGMPEAVVSQAQSILMDLTKRRVELEQQTAQWTFLRGIIAQRVDSLLQVIEESRHVKPVDLEMQVIEDVELLDVDYWSRGHLSEIEENLQQVNRVVLHPQCNQSITELQDWVNRLGDGVDEKLSSIVMFARYNALDAQIRRNLAAIASEVMEANGFRVVDYSEDTDAIQEPFFVIMQDDHGGEVTIDISPEEGYINNISIDMRESMPVMEYQLENQRREVMDELHRRGVTVQRLDQQKDPQPGLLPRISESSPAFETVEQPVEEWKRHLR